MLQIERAPRRPDLRCTPRSALLQPLPCTPDGSAIFSGAQAQVLGLSVSSSLHVDNRQVLLALLLGVHVENPTLS